MVNKAPYLGPNSSAQREIDSLVARCEHLFSDEDYDSTARDEALNCFDVDALVSEEKELGELLDKLQEEQNAYEQELTETMHTSEKLLYRALYSDQGLVKALRAEKTSNGEYKEFKPQSQKVSWATQVRLVCYYLFKRLEY